MAIAGQVDELEIGVAPGNIWQRRKRPVCFPVLIRRALEKTGDRPIEFDYVKLAVPREVEELLAAAQTGERRNGGHAFKRSEAGDGGFIARVIDRRHGTLVALVEPGAPLLRQNS